MKRLARLLAFLALVAALGLMTASLFFPPERMDLPPPPPLTGAVDRIVIEKAARRMQVFQDGKPVRTYRIALGFAPEGYRDRRGGGRTAAAACPPARRNDRSAFTLSLGLDYPRPEDVRRAALGGYSPGGDIFIHGQPNALPEGFKLKGDWTAGCVALSNTEIRELWAVTPIGTLVEIRP